MKELPDRSAAANTMIDDLASILGQETVVDVIDSITFHRASTLRLTCGKLEQTLFFGLKVYFHRRL